MCAPYAFLQGLLFHALVASFAVGALLELLQAGLKCELPLCEDRGEVEGCAFMTVDHMSDAGATVLPVPHSTRPPRTKRNATSFQDSTAQRWVVQGLVVVTR